MTCLQLDGFCVSQGGMYVLQLMDAYCLTYILLVLGVIEPIVLCWIYGEFYVIMKKIKLIVTVIVRHVYFNVDKNDNYLLPAFTRTRLRQPS